MKRQRVKNLSSLNNPAKAKEYAFLLLKFRLRSEKELLARLKQKGFSAELSLNTVNFLKDKEFINDRLFAKGWVAGRLKSPYGLRRIKQELVAKGLDKEIIEDSLNQAREGYLESQVVSRLARQRFSRQSGIEPQKAKARVYGYLLRRGFSPDIVSDTVKQL